MRLFAGALNNNRITRFLKNIRNSLLNFYFLRKKVVYLSPQIEELFKSPAFFCEQVGEDLKVKNEEIPQPFKPSLVVQQTPNLCQ